MFISLLTMLLAAEGEAEAAAQTAEQKPAEQETKTDAEKADDEAMKHLEESMKKMSGEGEGEAAKTNSATETQPEPKPEEQKPEPQKGEEDGAKPNPAPETKPETQTAEQPKPEEKKSDETDKLTALETSLTDYFDKNKEWNDEALDGFMRGVKSLVDEVKAIRAEQATVKAFIDDQNAQKLEAAIDEGFDALSDDLADVFGRGTGRKIEKAFLENREKALQQVAVLKAGYEATGQEYTLADLIRKAAMMLAPELVKTIPQNRKREFIAPPQKTEQTPLAGDDAAFEEFQKKYNELKPKE